MTDFVDVGYDKAVKTSCPTCFAAPGSGCVGQDGKKLRHTSHVSRVARAEDQLN